MEERARLIGARFEIQSAPQKGTRVEVSVQLPQDKSLESMDELELPPMVAQT